MCHGPGVQVVANVPCAGPVPPPSIVVMPECKASSIVIAFVSETDLDKIKKVSSGYFHAKNNEFAKVKVELVSSNETSTEELPYLALTSTYGGTIASREILGKKQVQRPENALY